MIGVLLSLDGRYEARAPYQRTVGHPWAAWPRSPADARWEPALGEFVLDWDDVRSSSDPHASALEFARSAFRHSCAVCGWDPALPASAEGTPAPVR